RERLRLDSSRIDPLTTRRSIVQFVNGFEYAARDSEDRVENDLFAKHYWYQPVSDQVMTSGNSISHISQSTHRFGAGDALRVRVAEGLICKASYEYATRLPRADEVFGDGSLVAPNLELVPETSHNANLGVLVQQDLAGRAGQVALEATGLLRYTDRMITRLLAPDRVRSIYRNVYSVRTFGADGVLRWSAPQRWLVLQVNATYLDQRNTSELGPFAHFKGRRLSNRPWLFGNASAALRIARFGANSGELTLFWFTRYVHSFLAGWEDAGTGDADDSQIPEQLVHSASLGYSVHSRTVRLDFALDLANLTDARVYDVLGVQRPGRAAYFKVTVGWDDSVSADAR
ncbi:MAG: hypothetical protein RL701_3274, partial [Pseudomonadota bacterium]